MNLSCWNDLDFDDYFIFKDDYIGNPQLDRVD